MNNKKALELGEKLTKLGHTIGTAESCTAGAISAYIASVSGASKYFRGGIVSYATDIKESILGVPHHIIEKCDVVSKEVAYNMALGAKTVLNVDYAVGITGYAGNTGGNEKSPNGTIWICVLNGFNGKRLFCKLFEQNDRKTNLEHAVEAAIDLCLEMLKQ